MFQSLQLYQRIELVATLNFQRIAALFLCVCVCFFSIRFVTIKRTHTGGDVDGGERMLLKSKQID